MKGLAAILIVLMMESAVAAASDARLPEGTTGLAFRLASAEIAPAIPT